MLSVKIITVGKLKEKEFEALCNEYLKRIRGFCKIEIEEIPETRLPDTPSQAQIDAALDTEAKLILKSVPNDAYVIPMCIEGKQISSTELAAKLNMIALKTSKLIFIIGGSNGLSDLVKNRGDFLLSFSKMTFAHHLFRVMLLEQIYRGFSINAGRSYHK